jgi:hypothetical protein
MPYSEDLPYILILDGNGMTDSVALKGSTIDNLER